MFGLFKKKTQKEKLLILYKKKKEEAFRLSRIDRKSSDEKEQEANDILEELSKLEKIKDVNK